MSGEFAGKVAVVSGGSRGIGRAIGLAFAREGADVVLAASSEKNLAAAAEAFAAAGVTKPLAVAADLRTLAGCEQVFARVRDKFGRCDILINNAGATKGGSFLDLPDELWLDGFALKFFGCVRLTRLFWPMLAKAQGHVVSIIGGAARTPSAQFLIGGSVNAAMANFNKGLAELGKRDGVNINVIHPGRTATDRNLELFKQRAATAGKSVEQAIADELAETGVRRLGTPEDVAEVTVFLCSERARHVQGTAIAVDGGWTPGYY
jgi:NAD(P)-dependent dehydrogenase (short-subunit alcohol dehydrogenase family)